MSFLTAALLYPRSASFYIFVVECLMWIAGLISPASARKTYYSKFASYAKTQGFQLSGRSGFLCLYTPAAVTATLYLASRFGFAGASAFFQSIGLTTLASVLTSQDTSVRLWILSVCLVIHFWKRVLEVTFLQHFSNKVDIVTVGIIATTYLALPIHLLYAQYLSKNLPPPALDCTKFGVVLFVVGILGNFYHHVLLAGLRKDGEKKYSIPRGGWFEWVTCPHYTFEVIEFFGLAMIAQTYVALAAAFYTTLYLGTRSRWTREWYIEKMEDYPQSRMGLIPFVF